ncbi:MAG: type II toxin-antitoxin system RelE/ParE family toxin [Chloroflexi bacterium]|nr:type II toxin-antitoxin system RelE/ParE family toxin [Chloroflexota bacterium]
MTDARYRLTIKRQAVRALQRMPRDQAIRIRGELDKLAEDPARRDIDVAALQGRSGYRLRVGGMRIIYERDDDARVIDILRIAPRGQAYGRTP